MPTWPLAYSAQARRSTSTGPVYGRGLHLDHRWLGPWRHRWTVLLTDPTRWVDHSSATSHWNWYKRRLRHGKLCFWRHCPFFWTGVLHSYHLKQAAKRIKKATYIDNHCHTPGSRVSEDQHPWSQEGLCSVCSNTKLSQPPHPSAPWKNKQTNSQNKPTGPPDVTGMTLPATPRDANGGSWICEQSKHPTSN